MTVPVEAFDKIVAATAHVSGVDGVEITGRSRRAGPALARLYAMAVATRKFGYTPTQVARALARDVTTITNSLNQLAAREHDDSRHRDRIDRIAQVVVSGVETATPDLRESAYTVSDKNDIAMVRSGADKAERALIALLRLDYGKYEIELPRKFAEVSSCFAD